jgi:acetolactate synthase-1/2/3 large subunit
VPGESYLDLLDALYDVAGRFELVVCRNEAGATTMAEAHGKLTGRPGLAFVTRAPGATHAAIGLHTALQDATPLVLVIGDVERGSTGRRAFQEADYPSLLGSLAKGVLRLDDPERVDEIVGRAFALAVAGRPGPVAIVVPEDVFGLPCRRTVAEAPAAVRQSAAEPDLRALAAELERAERPLVLAGGGAWSAEASEALGRFATARGLPVVVQFRCQDYLDNDHPSYVGELGLGLDPTFAADVRDADTVLVVGAELNDPTTAGYTLFDVPQARRRILQIAAAPEELGRVYRPAFALAADPRDAILRLAAAPPGPHANWSARTAELRARALARRNLIPARSGVDLGVVVEAVRARLPEDAVLVTDAGNFTLWVRRHFRYRRYGTQLSPRSGAMGYGVPAAIAAKLEHPDRFVVCITSDGCLGMAPTELATAVAHGLDIVILVVDNGRYGTIAMHQERRFPGRPIATVLNNPDFAALARAYGARGENVARTEDFAAAFERALAPGGPALLALATDPDALTPSLRVAAASG